MNTHKEKTKQRVVVPMDKERAHSSPLFYNHAGRETLFDHHQNFSISPARMFGKLNQMEDKNGLPK